MLTNFKNKTKVNNLIKESFRTLLELATLDSFFIFDGKYYKQKDGETMGSPLGWTMANVLLCHFEEQWMSDCPIDYLVVFWLILKIVLHISYKYNLVSTLLHRGFMIYSSHRTLHFEILKLKPIFEVTGTPKILLIVA